MNKKVKKMGGVSKLISALPGGDKAMAKGEVDEGALDRMAVIIGSMTKAERQKPNIINGSRRARIAAGAGVSVTEVNQLIKKFNETCKMIKKMSAAQAAQQSRKGKKGKKRPARGGFGAGSPLGGMSASDLKKLQDMLGE